MRAVILAAGIGRRLTQAGDENADRLPKCLLAFGGHTLLERHLRMLHAAGIVRIGVVTGWHADAIEAALDRLAITPRPETRWNPLYRDGSVVSLDTAAPWLTAGEETILMDADVLCDGRLLAPLLEPGTPQRLLLDQSSAVGEEPVKVCMRNGQVIELRKQIAPDLRHDIVGESVGFFRFSAAGGRRVAERVHRYLDQGQHDKPHEEVLRDLILESPPGEFGAEDVTGLPWIEIDFPEDVDRARTTILPLLETLPGADDASRDTAPITSERAP